MFLAQSLAAVVIVTVVTSQAGQPGDVKPQTALIEISFEHLAAADTEECNELNIGKSVIRKSPPANFRIDALEKSAPADEDDGSGFCASASGPAASEQDCHFNLLA